MQLNDMQMKKIIILIVFSLIFFESKATISWMDSLEEAQKISRLTNKPILIDFWATWCTPCKKMESDVWSRKEIKDLMQYYIPVKIDIDSNPILARKYDASRIPNVLILDSWGNKLYQTVGYKGKKFIERLLKDFSVNLVFINRAMEFLQKSEDNANLNLRVAQKYQDVIFALEREAKRAFLRKSNYYLKRAKKLFSKEVSNQTKQKIDLLQLLNRAYSNRTKSTLRRIDKIEVAKVEDSNKSLYHFIRFYCLNERGNKEESLKELENLEKIGGTLFLSRAKHLLSKSK